MTPSELPPEASEADVLEQQAEVRPDPDDQPRIASEPGWEADPADVAEQSLPVEDEDDYPDVE